MRPTVAEGRAAAKPALSARQFAQREGLQRRAKWSETSYRFVKRQSQTDPNVWVSLGDPRPAVSTAAATR
jgi:hypothetical protein